MRVFRSSFTRTKNSNGIQKNITVLSLCSAVSHVTLKRHMSQLAVITSVSDPFGTLVTEIKSDDN